MKGLTSVTFRQLDCERILDLSVKAGLDMIEWGGDIHVPSGDIAKAELVGEMTRSRGIIPLSYGSYFRLNTEGYDLKAFTQAAKTAQALGAEIIRIWTSRRDEQSNGPSLIDGHIRQLNELCPIAKDHGLTIGLEYHRNTLTESGADTKALLEGVEAENLRTYWQPNPELSHRQRLDELEILGAWICCFHTFHWVHEGTKDIRLPLDMGLTLWQDYVKALGISSIPMIMEFVKGDSEKQFLRDVKCLEKIAAG